MFSSFMLQKSKNGFCSALVSLPGCSSPSSAFGSRARPVFCCIYYGRWSSPQNRLSSLCPASIMWTSLGRFVATSTVCLVSVIVTVRLSLCLSVCLSVCLCMYIYHTIMCSSGPSGVLYKVYIHVSVHACLSVCLLICPSVCLCTRLSSAQMAMSMTEG